MSLGGALRSKSGGLPPHPPRAWAEGTAPGAKHVARPFEEKTTNRESKQCGGAKEERAVGGTGLKA